MWIHKLAGGHFNTRMVGRLGSYYRPAVYDINTIVNKHLDHAKQFILSRFPRTKDYTPPPTSRFQSLGDTLHIFKLASVSYLGIVLGLNILFVCVGLTSFFYHS